MHVNFLVILLAVLLMSGTNKEFKLKTGDLLFSVSKEKSDFVNAIKKSTAEKADVPYSHAGIIFIENNQPFILVATAPEGVVKTLLADFIAKTALLNNKPVMSTARLDQDYYYTIFTAIETLLGQPYDYAYDESNYSYYCSELVRYAFIDSTSNFIFYANSMSFKSKNTNETIPYWIAYYQKLQLPIPEGEPGTNPMDMSKSKRIEMVHYYYD